MKVIEYSSIGAMNGEPPREIKTRVVRFLIDDETYVEVSPDDANEEVVVRCAGLGWRQALVIRPEVSNGIRIAVVRGGGGKLESK